MTECSYKRIGAVKTAAGILDRLAEMRGATARELAEGLGLPYGTVMSYLATLSDCGWVKQDGERFLVGQKLAVYWALLRAELQEQKDLIKSALAALG